MIARVSPIGLFLTLLSFLLFPQRVEGAFSAPESGKVDMFLSVEPEIKQLYAGEPSVFKVFLYSSDPNLAYAEQDSNIQVSLNKSFSDNDCKVFPVGNEPMETSEVNFHGKIYFRVTLGAYVVLPLKDGKLDIEIPSYNVGLKRKVAVDHPFRGRILTYRTENVVVKGRSESIRVRKLPEVKDKADFSGCVGDFFLTSYFPPGKIKSGEPALVVIELEGVGWIPSESVPDYRKAFPPGCKLKSVAENRTNFIRDNQLISRLELECEFMPDVEGEVEIGNAEIITFNPSTGKYQKIVSEPVSERIDSKTSKTDSGKGQVWDI